jgi:trans-aconitate methyltransferase
MGDSYWDGWYQSGGTPDIPSQFAVMVASEFACRVERIVDFGCGNGRDSVLLDRVAPTVGIDASAQAIAAARLKHPAGEFRCGSVEQVEGEGLLYARFLLHAIPEQAEDALMDRLEGRWMVAFEFRTPEDSSRPKVTPDHYRRPVDVGVVCGKLAARGFTVTYRVEGRGMAKFGADDAYVGRVLAERL